MSNVPAYPKSPLLESNAASEAPRPSMAAADPRPFVPARDPRPFVAASERDEDKQPGSELRMGIDEALWHARLGDMIEIAPVTTVMAVGCVGIGAGLALRWLIAR